MGLTRADSLPVVVTTAAAAGIEVAQEIATLVRERRKAGRSAVLGLATGRTPIPIYAELVRLHREEDLSFRGVQAFNVDEYIGPSATGRRRFRAWMEDVFYRHVDFDRDLVHIPASDLAEPALDAACRDYEGRIASAGGIDLQILGLGRNGHIGFNEPGSAQGSRTRVVRLARETREDAAATFGGLERTPERAITLGVATIREARRIRVLAFGAAKRSVVERLLDGPMGPDVPATFLRGHADVRLYVDRASAGARAAPESAP